MSKRKGVFIGFYGPADLKRQLQERATSEHRTLSAEVQMRLEKSLKQEGGQAAERSGAIGAPRSGGIGGGRP